MSFTTATATANAASACASSKVDNFNEYERTFLDGASSVYVHWVPDELTTDYAKWLFSKYGEVDRVEFVPHKNGKGRMMFVHFNYWHETQESLIFRNSVLFADPNEGYPIQIGNEYRIYKLMCKVNKRPIPVVDYNTHQLSDMFERLNTRVTEEISVLRKENEELKQMLQGYHNYTLKTQFAYNCARIHAEQLSAMKRTLSNYDENMHTYAKGYCSESD
jgi:hypothetical protein